MTHAKEGPKGDNPSHLVVRGEFVGRGEPGKKGGKETGRKGGLQKGTKQPERCI